MRFEVPQFIEVEDKIFGPFTWKQFIYLAGGASVVLIAFFTLPFFLFLMIGVPVAALAGFLAFHEINNRPFSVFLESFVKYVTNKKLYLWKRSHQQTITGASEGKPSSPNIQTTPASKERISSLSRRLTLTTLEAETDAQRSEHKPTLEERLSS